MQKKYADTFNGTSSTGPLEVVNHLNNMLHTWAQLMGYLNMELVGGPGPPLWKIWVRQLRDDESNPILIWENKQKMATIHHQPDMVSIWLVYG